MTPFTKRDYYYLYAAVRGSDTCKRHLVLKEQVVARIRGILFEEGCHVPGCWTPCALAAVRLAEVEHHIAIIVTEAQSGICYSELQREADEHFIYHLSMAVRSSIDHPIWGSYGYDLYCILDSVKYTLVPK